MEDQKEHHPRVVREIWLFAHRRKNTVRCAQIIRTNFILESGNNVSLCHLLRFAFLERVKRCARLHIKLIAHFCNDDNCKDNIQLQKIYEKEIGMAACFRNGKINENKHFSSM